MLTQKIIRTFSVTAIHTQTPCICRPPLSLLCCSMQDDRLNITFSVCPHSVLFITDQWMQVAQIFSSSSKVKSEIPSAGPGQDLTTPTTFIADSQTLLTSVTYHPTYRDPPIIQSYLHIIFSTHRIHLIEGDLKDHPSQTLDQAPKVQH